jgi:hypothetical protein
MSSLLDDPRKLVEHLRLAGEDMAKLNCAAKLLEDTRGSVLAQIMKEQGDVSVAKAEMLAKADERYINHIKCEAEARKNADMAKVRWISGQAYLDLIRTMEASKRSEMQMAGRA